MFKQFISTILCVVLLMGDVMPATAAGTGDITEDSLVNETVKSTVSDDNYISTSDFSDDGYFLADDNFLMDDNSVSDSNIEDDLNPDEEEYYTLTFNPNGGSGKMWAVENVAAEAAITIPENVYTRKYYTFEGWNTEADGSGDFYEDGGELCNPEQVNPGQVILYAQWIPKIYTITYVLNDKDDVTTDNSANPDEYTYEDDDIILAKPTRVGYTFKGWYTDKGLTKKATKIKGGSHVDKKYYAKWSTITYKITYNLNGGKNASNPTSYKISTKTTVLKNPTKKGYKFEGWFTDENFENQITQIEKGTVGNLNLYAKWSLINYTVEYRNVTPEEIDGYPTSYTINSGKYVLGKPERAGYKFIGWYTDSKCTKEITSIKGSSAKNRVIYAKWSKIKYKIRYGLAGGTNSSSNKSTYTIESDDIYLKNPTKKGYKFAGWFADVKRTIPFVSIPKGSTGDVSVYAKWDLEYYSISYELDGGTNNSKNPDGYSVEDEPITLYSPKKEGYKFAGWYKDSKFKKKISSIKSGTTGDMVLYARWVVEKYDVVFDANGGEGVMSTLTYDYGETYKLPLCDYVKQNYYFAGWNTKADGKGTGYEMGQSVKNLVSNKSSVTLYAIWKKFGSTELAMSSEVVSQVNTKRKAAGVKELTVDAKLSAIAQERAREIAMLWGHIRPDGVRNCFSLYNTTGYAYSSAGENIAKGYRSASEVMTGWMNKTDHKNNIMNSGFGRIGVGCYNYNGVYYWVQCFSN